MLAVPEESERGFREAGMATLRGHARFREPDRLEVGDDRVRAARIVIATGARPRTLGIEGEDLLMTSEGFLNLPRLPREILFVGGGYVSFEFAFVAAVAGASVTILQRGPRVLKHFEPELVEALLEAAAEAGIRVETDACVDRVARSDGRLAVGCDEHPDRTWVADLVVHGAGRVPDLDDLGLASGQVEASSRGVLVDEHLKSVSNPRVYAVGDVAATPFQLATTADMEGETAARNILEGDRHVPAYEIVPSAVFTQPPLCSVGLSESGARDAGRDFRVNRGHMNGWPSSRRIGQRHTAFKILIENGTGRILGAHLLGHGMEEAVNVLALAMRQRIRSEDLRRAVWSYPTYVSDVRYMLA